MGFSGKENPRMDAGEMETSELRNWSRYEVNPERQGPER